MRRAILLLLITLLPLRIWAADAMALSVLPPAAEAATAVAAATPPCHGHMASSLAHGDPVRSAMAHAQPEGTSDGDHASCTSCDICHGTVLSGPAATCGGSRQPSAQPARAGVRFASAVLQGHLKPPIS